MNRRHSADSSLGFHSALSTQHSTLGPQMTDYPFAQLGLKRMQRVYEAGLAGLVPVIPVSYEDLKTKAKAKLKGEAFDYVAGGAGGEETIRSNGAAFTKWRIIPRMLRDVSGRDHKVRIFTQEFNVPVFIA